MTKSDVGKEGVVATPTALKPNEVEVLVRQKLVARNAALIQEAGTNNYRLLYNDTTTKYIPEKSETLPNRFTMEKSAFGKLIKPEPFGTHFGLGKEAGDAIDFALWRRGILNMAEFGEIDSSITSHIISAVGAVIARRVGVLKSNSSGG